MPLSRSESRLFCAIIAGSNAAASETFKAMRAFFWLLLSFYISGVLPAAAERRPLLVEETFLTVTIGGKNYRLAALIAKEAGSTGRLPVALITHGQSEPEKRVQISSRSYFFLAREFARRGWLAVVVVRRGFGQSDREAPHALRPCENGAYYASELKGQTDDLEATIEALGRRSDADASTVLAVGQSVGGAVFLDLATRHPEGLKAVVSFAGGMKSVAKPGASPSTPCKAEDLIPLFARFGERSRLPTLWFYAKNDSLFPPDYVRSLHEAYVAKGGQAQLHIFDPIGQEGHLMVGDPDGMLHWLPLLDRFLRDNKLKTYDPAPIQRALRDRHLPAPAFRVASSYDGRPTEKVLAISQSKGGLQLRFGGEDLTEMENAAREECEKVSKEPCRIVLRNFEAVPWDGDARPPSAPPSPTTTKGAQ